MMHKFQPEPVPTFYADETSLEIEDKPHILIAAMSFSDPELAIGSILKIRKDLAIPLSLEIKWNQKTLPRQLRYEISDRMLSVASKNSKALIAIRDGTDKEKIAEMMTRQIADYCHGPFSLYLDKNLCPDMKKLWEFALSNLTAPSACVALQEVDSSRDQLMQCVDVFAGLYKTAIEHAVRDINKKRKCYDENTDEEYEDSIRGYILEKTRFCLPGDVDFCTGTLDGVVLPPEPFKDSWGCGLRLESSISEEACGRIQRRIAATYVGAVPERITINRFRKFGPGNLEMI